MDGVVQTVADEDGSEILAAMEDQGSILVLANSYGEMRYMYGKPDAMQQCSALAQVLEQYRPWFSRQIEQAKLILMNDGECDIITPFGFGGGPFPH